LLVVLVVLVLVVVVVLLLLLPGHSARQARWQFTGRKPPDVGEAATGRRNGGAGDQQPANGHVQRNCHLQHGGGSV